MKHEGLKKYNLAKRFECLLLKPLVRSFGDYVATKPVLSGEDKAYLDNLFNNSMKILPSDYAGLEIYSFMIVALDDPKAYAELCLKVGKIEGFDFRKLIPIMMTSFTRSIDLLWLMSLSEDFESILDESRQCPTVKNDINWVSLFLAVMQNRSDSGKAVQIVVNKIRMLERRNQETLIAKFCTIISKCNPDITYLILQVAGEMGKFAEMKSFALACLWTIFSGSINHVNKIGETLGISFWSELCLLLNSSVRPSIAIKSNALEGWSEITSGQNYFELEATCFTFDWAIFQTSLLLREPLRSGLFAQLVTFDDKRNIFHLGSYFLTPSDEEDDNDKILSDKAESLSKPKPLSQHHEDVKELIERKQVLSHHASRLKKSEISIDPTKCLFVIDTNVLVAQPGFLDRFRDLPFSMTIPVIVLEELVILCDHPNVEKSRNAKAALALLDTFKEFANPTKLRLTSLLASGKQLEGFDTRSEPFSHGNKSNDDIILQTCRGLKSKDIVLISDDLNMRLKGKAMGITMLTMRELFELL